MLPLFCSKFFSLSVAYHPHDTAVIVKKSHMNLSLAHRTNSLREPSRVTQHAAGMYNGTPTRETAHQWCNIQRYQVFTLFKTSAMCSRKSYSPWVFFEDRKKKIEKKRTHKQVTHMLIAMLMNVKPRTCIWVTGGEVPRLGGSQRERWPSWGPTTAPWNDITCFQSTVSIWTK
jgi:hypothetical protein